MSGLTIISRKLRTVTLIFYRGLRRQLKPWFLLSWQSYTCYQTVLSGINLPNLAVKNERELLAWLPIRSSIVIEGRGLRGTFGGGRPVRPQKIPQSSVQVSTRGRTKLFLSYIM